MRWSVVRAAIVLAGVAGCDHGDITPPPPEITEVASIQLGMPSFTLSQAAVQPIDPVYRDVNGELLTQMPDAQWTSSNPGVASVDQTGHVTGMSLGGPVTITVVANGHTATATVTSVVPDRINFTPFIESLAIGQTMQLIATPLDFNGSPIALSGGQVQWSTTDASVASVNDSGLLTVLSGGDAVIAASFAGRTTGLPLKTGAVSEYDGTWLATLDIPNSHTTVEVRMLFGRVQQLKLSNTLTAGGCTITIDFIAKPDLALSSAGNFTIVLPYRQVSSVSSPAANLSGQVGAGGQFSLVHTGMIMSTQRCPDNGTPVGMRNHFVYPATYTMRRQ